MDALAEAGERDEALTLLKSMKTPGSGCKPDKRTYTAAIKAMIKRADIVAGRGLFEEMVEEARIVPDAVTYCTLMELYGAAGQKEQVRERAGLGHMYVGG
jgi:pentatricopeptide repeat protein